MVMKNIKWKSLIITVFVCLFGIVPGLFVWDGLPQSIPIHFDIYNNPDNFANKGFVVFALPVIMALFQIFTCISTDVNSHKHGESIKFERVTKWIIPVISLILQLITLLYGLGLKIDIRRIVSVIVGLMFIALGNYLPKLDYIKNYNFDKEKARKINRLLGFETVIMGILALITTFLPTVCLIIWLFLFIPYVVIAYVYRIITVKKK